MSVQIDLFGPVTVTIDGDPIQLAPPLLRLLIPWLAIHPGKHLRTDVGDAIGAKGSTYRGTLRRAIPTPLHTRGVLWFDERHIELRGEPPAVELSTRRFALLADSDDPDDWDQAWRLGRTGLLSEFAAADGWVAEARADHRAALIALCQRGLRGSDGDERLGWAERWLALDAHSDAAATRIVEALRSVGEPRQAEELGARALAELESSGIPTTGLQRALSGGGALGGDGDAHLRASPVEAPGLRSAPARPIGRAREAGLLESRLRLLAQGRRIVLLEGDPGIGKAYLCGHVAGRFLAGETPGSGAPAVLYGIPGQQRYYKVFWQALEGYFAGVDDERLWWELGDAGPDLLRHLPALAPRLVGVRPRPAGDPGSDRLRLFEAVASTLGLIARDGPVLFVIAELQDAGPDDLELLRYLLSASAELPVMFLCTLVPQAPALAPFLQAVQRDHPDVERLRVMPLTPELTLEFAAEHLGEPLDEAISDVVYARTGGVALSIKSYLRPDRGSAVAPGDDDPGPAEALMTLKALAPPAREVLGVASLLGREFAIEQLREAARDPDAVPAALALAQEARIVAPVVRGSDERELRFTHELLREAARSAVPTADLGELSARAATVLSKVDVPNAAKLAPLWQLAGERARARDAWRLAATEAAEALASEQAVSHFRSALALCEPDDPPASERCELLLELGRALWRVGAFRDSAATFKQAADLAGRIGEAELLAHAALGLAGPLGFQGVTADTSLTRALEQALSALPDADGPLRARVLANYAQARTFSAPPTQVRDPDPSVEALAMARRLKDDRVLLEVLCHASWASWTPENLDERRRNADEMVTLADAQPDPALQLESRVHRVATAMEAGDRDLALADVERCHELTNALTEPYYRALVKLMDGMVALLDGPDAAAPLAKEALELGQREQNQGVMQLFGAQMLAIRLLQARTEDLRAASESLTAYYHSMAAWRAGLALVYTELDRLDDALREVEALCATDFAAVPRDIFWLVTMDHLARTCAALYERGCAIEPARLDRLYELLLPFADRYVVAGGAVAVHGPVHLSLGLLQHALGDAPRAISHFSNARTRAVALQCRPVIAEAAVELARTSLSVGSGSPAPHLATLRTMFNEARELGLMRLVGRIEEATNVAIFRAEAQSLTSVRETALALERELATFGEEQQPARLRSRTRAWIGRTIAGRGMPRLGGRVEAMSDEQLTRLLSHVRVQQALLHGMARLYQPDRGCGFTGEVEFRFVEALDAEPISVWHFTIDAKQARALESPASMPEVSLTITMPDFARLLTRQLNGVQGWVEGRLAVDGDPMLAARLVEMFGGQQALIGLDEPQ